jgi:hypothetical protein
MEKKKGILCPAPSAVGTLSQKIVISDSYSSDFSDFYGYTE